MKMWSWLGVEELGVGCLAMVRACFTKPYTQYFKSYKCTIYASSNSHEIGLTANRLGLHAKAQWMV